MNATNAPMQLTLTTTTTSIKVFCLGLVSLRIKHYGPTPNVKAACSHYGPTPNVKAAYSLH